MYDASGTENLRANPTVMGPSKHETPSMSGGDVGGRENLKANATIMGPSTRSTPGGSNHIPVKSYKDSEV